MSGIRTTVDDRVWRQLREKVRGIGHARVKVGVLGGTTSSGVSLPELAAIHEYGAPAANIPARSFLRFTVKNRREDITRLCEKLARSLLAEKMEIDQALGILGAWMVSAVKKSITQRLIKQDLAQATIVRKTGGKTGKKGTAALIDTGQLINAISSTVDKAGE